MHIYIINATECNLIFNYQNDLPDYWATCEPTKSRDTFIKLFIHKHNYDYVRRVQPPLT